MGYLSGCCQKAEQETISFPAPPFEASLKQLSVLYDWKKPLLKQS
jgi:hypothetical protein